MQAVWYFNIASSKDFTNSNTEDCWLLKSANEKFELTTPGLRIIAFETERSNFAKLEELGAKVYEANISGLQDILTTNNQEVLAEDPSQSKDQVPEQKQEQNKQYEPDMFDGTEGDK